MGASTGYQRATNPVGIYGASGQATPVVANLPNALYIPTTIGPFSNPPSLTANTETFNLANLNVGIGNVGFAIISVVNKTGQVIEYLFITNFDSNFNVANPPGIIKYFFSPIVNIAAGSTKQAIIPFPYSLPFPEMKIEVQFAAPTTGSVGIAATLYGSEGATGMSPIPPVTQTLTLASPVELVAVPSTGGQIYLRSVIAGNTSATLTTLDLQVGATGTPFVSQPLAASGGGFNKEWVLFPLGGALYGTLSTAVTDVRVNIEYLIGP